jgi:hypothetical protein
MMSGPGDLATGDFDGDGHIDLAAGAFYWGNGDGTFVQGAALPCAVEAAADLDHDGIVDVVGRVQGAYGSDTIVTALGTGGRMFATPTALPQLPFWFTGLISADLNGDGRLDLITSGGGALQVLLDLP